jgi:AdoMet-dependent heme synthase
VAGKLHPEGLELFDSQGNHRGFVDPKMSHDRPVFEDLWIVQGSICDLRCRHCYTASSPSNNRLQQITFAELKPHLEDARRFGVQQIYFTGGEVFVNDDVLHGRARQNEEFLQSLSFALSIAPVEILTNGRTHIRNHLEELVELRNLHGDRLKLRVTLESPRPEEHDAIRGKSTFAQTTATIRMLGDAGFIPVITAERPLLSPREDGEIRNMYESLFPGMSVEVNLIGNMIEMGHQLQTLAQRGIAPQPETFITTNCFAILNQPPETLMCHYSRCIQKIDGALRYYPCPVIYDDERFDLGATLAESWRRVYLGHKNCYDYCMKGRGATCRTKPI